MMIGVKVAVVGGGVPDAMTTGEDVGTITGGDVGEVVWSEVPQEASSKARRVNDKIFFMVGFYPFRLDCAFRMAGSLCITDFNYTLEYRKTHPDKGQGESCSTRALDF
jgi:hypothetical protein